MYAAHRYNTTDRWIPMNFKHRTPFCLPLANQHMNCYTRYIKCIVILIENLELDITFSVQKKGEISE